MFFFFFFFFCFFFTFSFFLRVIVLFLLNCCPPLENQIYVLEEKNVVPFWSSSSFSGPSRSQTNDTWHCLLKSLSCVEIPPPCPLLWCHELPQLILLWSPRFPHWSEIKINHSEAGLCWLLEVNNIWFFSCPEQLNRWPCHSVGEWVSDLLILEHKTSH